MAILRVVACQIWPLESHANLLFCFSKRISWVNIEAPNLYTGILVWSCEGEERDLAALGRAGRDWNFKPPDLGWESPAANLQPVLRFGGWPTRPCKKIARLPTQVWVWPVGTEYPLLCQVHLSELQPTSVPLSVLVDRYPPRLFFQFFWKGFGNLNQTFLSLLQRSSTDTPTKPTSSHVLVEANIWRNEDGIGPFCPRAPKRL